MQPNIRVMLFDEDGERFFGEGPCRLLHAIEQTGSLRAAAQSMQMAYTKRGLVRHAEQVLGLRHRAKSAARAAAAAYLPTRQRSFSIAMSSIVTPANRQENSSIRSFSPMKSEIGCVIMASGLAKRFGSNKLLAEFDRKPLLCRAFAVTEGLHRVVVTRSTEVQALCEKYGIPVLHHAHPLRSDTVRLDWSTCCRGFAIIGCVFLPG